RPGRKRRPLQDTGRLGDLVVQLRLEPLSTSERHILRVPGQPVHLHAGVPWKTCSNFCSAPAGASTGPNTGARSSSISSQGCSPESFSSLPPASPRRSSSSWSSSSSSPGYFGDSPSPRSGCMTATRARGGSWCFMGCRRCSASLRKPHGLPEQQARCSITSWLWPVLRSQSGDLSKSDSCAAPPGPTHMGPIRSCKLNGEAERQMQGGGGSDAGELAALLFLHGAPCAATRKRQIPTAPKNEKKPDGHQATGRGLQFWE